MREKAEITENGKNKDMFQGVLLKRFNNCRKIEILNSIRIFYRVNEIPYMKF